MKFLTVLVSAAVLATACSADTSADQARFESSVRECSADSYALDVAGFAGVEYTIRGVEDGACVIDMAFTANPNPDWVGEALTVRLAEPRTPQALQETMSACLEGRMPQISDGTCSGSLLAVLGHATNQPQGSAMAAGDFSAASCGKPYTAQTPPLYRMHDETSDTWGYLDAAGDWAIAPQFTQAQAFSEGLAAVLKDGVWQVIDASGTAVIPNIGAASSMSYQKFGSRQIFTSPINGFSEGCARYIKDDGTRLYLSRGGQLWMDKPTPQMQAAADAVGGIVDDIYNFHAGLARFDIEVEAFGAMDPVGFIDGNGKVAIPAIYARAKDFDVQTGLAAVGLARDEPSAFAKGWVYINTKGEIVLPADGSLYKNAEAFSDGVAVFGESFDDYYIDTAGEKLSIGPFSSAFGFSGGIALVRSKSGDYGWINAAGEMVFTQKDIGLCSTDFAQGQRYENGFILLVVSKDGAPCGDGRSTSLGGGAETFQNGEFAYIDASGEVKWRASDFAQ